MIIKNIFFLFTYLSVLLSSCVSFKAGHDSKTQAALEEFWLSTSMYGGNFYDDPSITLLDYRSFSAIDDALMPDGFSFYPPPPNHIVPAGTLVEITKIAYPTALEKFQRPLYSPKESIWVYLKVARERGRVNIFRENTHIIIVPKRFSTEEQVKNYLAQFLSTIDPNTWILRAHSSIQEAIWQKKPLVGMNKQEVIAALGPALKRQFPKELDLEENQETWHYSDYFIAFNEEIVTKVRLLEK